MGTIIVGNITNGYEVCKSSNLWYYRGRGLAGNGKWYGGFRTKKEAVAAIKEEINSNNSLKDLI